MKINELITELRKNYKSDNKMSMDLGISRQAIKHIQEGLNHPKDETIILICKKLGVDPAPVIIETQKDKAKGEAKKIWVQIEKKLASVAASIFLVTTLSTILNSAVCILCKIVNVKNSTKLKAV